MKRNSAASTANRTEISNKKIETYKLVFDLMKHLTTLSSGSILILIALLEKVFRAAPPTIYLRFAFGGFCISIIAAVVAMVLLSFNASDGDIPKKELNVFATASTVASAAFIVGIVYTIFAAVPSFG
jgi:hypothetical protein